MVTMTVSLTDPMKDWIETQIKAGDYASSSDYVGDLVRRDREHKEQLTALRQLLDEAASSGVSPRTLDDVFEDARARARQAGLPNG